MQVLTPADRAHGRIGALAVTTSFAAIALAAVLTGVAWAGTPSKVHFTARGSAEQVDVTGARHGQRLKLVDRRGDVVDKERAGSLGGIVFRHVRPGGGYRVRQRGGGQSTPLRVLSNRPSPPNSRIYDQTLPTSGYGYLATRDGTKLAIDVHLPSGGGPYPTLIEYSGYGYANPNGGESSTAPIATALGFAVVDVNMRGTGCSGGAFDYFEPLQALDGYDVIETVARQPWVLHHHVGMMGVSYGGISQLFVGATRPPALAAIAPLSVIDNTQTTLYPGGILNTGFALKWAEDRVHDALPASPTGGQGWAYERIQNGDTTCESNQDLHPEAVNLIRKIRRNNYYRPKIADPLSPITFVHKIRAPVFLACQWTDEQTGGHCPALPSHFTGTNRKWFTFTNGTHIDSLDPETFNRWYDFLKLYVARQRPELTAGQKALAPLIYQTAMGVSGVNLPPDPIQGEPSYRAARSAFQALPPVRILFDNGAGGSDPGAPFPAFERSFSRFPVPHTRARSLYLAEGGELKSSKRSKAGAEAFTWDQSVRPPTDFTGNTGSGPGGLWTTTPDYHWTQSPTGHAVSYMSSRLDSQTAVIGAGALQAWIRSSSRNVDLQATVSEVRPDGKETFVQSGWLTSSGRKLDREKSTLLEPVLSLRKPDAAPLPKDRWGKVTIPLYYEGHVYRKHSRIRVTLAAAGGDQPIWAFGEAKPHGTARVSVAHSRQMPSRLLLPVVPGVHTGTDLPPCPGLRGEPCRNYKPFVNREVGVR
ncbi:MAG TPA: CocE/NonD family hydrolase [Solirubrobacterales bacterium]